jgi:alpha-methylacyl-CoA racemase
MTGPLAGIRIVELAGLGPAPFAGMMLADAGADIIRIDRYQAATYPPQQQPHDDLLNRGRRSVAVDLKSPAGVELILDLAHRSDALIEGFRPGVAERLGVGPEACLARRPELVYGRMTGWGQDGPMAAMAGHDIDYIAIGGALGSIGRSGERPMAPLNLVGDFGGGGMLLAFGVLAAILSARSTGQGQVVDTAMVDGTAALMTMTYGFRANGIFSGERGTNILDTGAHFYEVYETSDGGYFAVGAIEPQFYALLIERLGLADESLPRQMDRSSWSGMKQRFATIFASRTREEWAAVFDGTDACAVPVLDLDEAPAHPHNLERGTFVEVAGVVQPAPAPRFSATPTSIRRPPPNPGQHGDEALLDWGLAEADIERLRGSGAIR